VLRLLVLVGVFLGVGACAARSERRESAASTGTGGDGATAGLGGAPSAGTSALPVAGRAALEQVCTPLEQANWSALTDSLQCDPNVTTAQCTLLVDLSPMCGCAWYVNPANTDAVAGINATQQQYVDLGCKVVDDECRAGPCSKPTPSTCVPTSSGSPAGKCQ